MGRKHLSASWFQRSVLPPHLGGGSETVGGWLWVGRALPLVRGSGCAPACGTAGRQRLRPNGVPCAAQAASSPLMTLHPWPCVYPRAPAYTAQGKRSELYRVGWTTALGCGVGAAYVANLRGHADFATLTSITAYHAVGLVLAGNLTPWPPGPCHPVTPKRGGQPQAVATPLGLSRGLWVSYRGERYSPACYRVVR